MQTLYRVEIFDRNFNFILHQVIPEPDVELDYLTLSESTIVLPLPAKLNAGWYVNILRNNSVYFQGVITSTDDPQKNMKLKIKPLLSLFDVQIYKTPAGAYTSTEGWLAAALRQEFINNSDTVECIPGLTVTYTSSTMAVPLELDSNTHKLWDVAVKALELAQIVIEATLYPQAQKIIVTIAKNQQSAVFIESELPGITVKSFSVDTGTSTNKVVVYNKDNDTECVEIYAENYSSPTKKEIKVITVGEDEEFRIKAEETAAAVLDIDKFNNCIELSFSEGCNVMPYVTIGQRTRILRRGIEYTAYLTSISLKGNIKTYTFGRRRRELTKKIRLEMIK